MCVNEQRILGTTLPQYLASIKGGKITLKQLCKLFKSMRENSQFYTEHQEVVSGEAERVTKSMLLANPCFLAA